MGKKIPSKQKNKSVVKDRIIYLVTMRNLKLSLDREFSIKNTISKQSVFIEIIT